jgi:ring-1,2-phenylacetyl-CoA epoxidase subunit PaaC
MTTLAREAAKAGDLADDVRDAVRDLILVLADSKRLLGMRYGQWILGAPELEAGIACASMAQDEWGHGRLLYAMLRDFDEDVDRLEHGRDAADYRSIDVLDAEPGSWIELVAINALVDAAITVQLEALAGSSYLPLRQRVQKLIEEETFHTAHGAAWFRRIGGVGGDARSEMKAAAQQVLPGVLRWFGPDSDRARSLRDAGIVDGVGSDLRTRYLQRVAPLLQHASDGTADGFGDASTGAGVEPDFAAFDEASRRSATSAPDQRTIEQVRGDRNRAFLMD